MVINDSRLKKRLLASAEIAKISDNGGSRLAHSSER